MNEKSNCTTMSFDELAQLVYQHTDGLATVVIYATGAEVECSLEPTDKSPEARKYWNVSIESILSKHYGKKVHFLCTEDGLLIGFSELSDASGAIKDLISEIERCLSNRYRVLDGDDNTVCVKDRETGAYLDIIIKEATE